MAISAEQYREQAVSLRRMAQGLSAPELKEQLLELARDYDELADRAQQRDEAAAAARRSTPTRSS